ncbi:MAG: mannose-1-phosphate guanylyltransferase/mannose-6-phosphate isomerase [Limnobacter sp.]|uniref:mannose-1-phosphate guanylyltransferase/mannose-6-phosphate isomerase n=1 Tax=Limnobacter sp. TaxID=2003368 RepID=UPI003919000F
MSQVIPVILCGGSGSRLWPLSRDQHPKQFLRLVDQYSLLQSTIRRAQVAMGGDPIFVANDAHRFLVAEQVRQLESPLGDIILEPVARNTAPAIAAAAFRALDRDAQSTLLVMPSDQLIPDAQAFSKAVAVAVAAAEQGALVTFGVKPTFPSTGYGYIKAAAQPAAAQATPVECFVEKPNETRAQEFIDSGAYLWNSGMFVFKAATYLAELQALAPAMYSTVKASVDNGKADLDFFRLDKTEFEQSPSDSIDYAVMEKTAKAAVVPLDLSWSDVGAWDAVWEVSPKDSDGNVLMGDVLATSTHNTLVKTTGRMVATVGVDNIVVVETADAVLVASKDKAQDVKKVVEQLKSLKRSEYLHHREVARPWGSYDSIGMGTRFQVKRITVKPGAKLSLQMHHHRAEHWIVVSGTARVRIDEKEFLMTENESCYIPVGQKHFLENPGVIPLELIEVQSGSYLGEDDIVRFEDRYGRV